MSWNGDEVSFIPSAELPDHVARSIAEVQAETKESTDQDGIAHRTVKLKLKFYDKLTAADQITRHFGWYKPTKTDTETQVTVRMEWDEDGHGADAAPAPGAAAGAA